MKYQVFSRSQQIDIGLLALQKLFDDLFGLQQTSYSSLFEQNRFWFNNSTTNNEGNADSLKLDKAMYLELPDYPCRHWSHGQFSLFACGCDYFKSS